MKAKKDCYYSSCDDTDGSDSDQMYFGAQVLRKSKGSVPRTSFYNRGIAEVSPNGINGLDVGLVAPTSCSMVIYVSIPWLSLDVFDIPGESIIFVGRFPRRFLLRS